MKFKSDAQRRAVMLKFSNRFSNASNYYNSNLNHDISSAVKSPPKYMFAEKPVDQFSMKSDLEDIRKNLKNVSSNQKYPSELRARAESESERVSKILAEKFVDKDDVVLNKIPTYEDVELHLKKEGIEPDAYYADNYIPRIVSDVNVPSPVKEQLSEQERIREDIKEGKIKLDTPILTQTNPETGEKTISYWDKVKKWVRI